MLPGEDIDGTTADEDTQGKEKPVPASSVRSTMGVGTFIIIVLWYASNIGVILLNKYLLSYYGFKYPVFLTLCHMVGCAGYSFAFQKVGVVPLQSIKSRSQGVKVCSLAAIFCLSVVLGNVSLRWIPVSFNQAIGATTPVATAIFSFLLLGRVEARSVYLALVPVVVGIVLASGAEPLFDLGGFTAALSATAARALKSVVQDILLSDPSEALASMSLLTYMSPVAAALLLPASFVLEGNVFAKAAQLAHEKPGFVWLLFLNVTAAFAVNLTNFLVTKQTSALTLQVLGNAKGVIAVVVSIILFQNPVSGAGLVGYTITVFGVVLYSEARKAAQNQQRRKAVAPEAPVDLEAGGGDESAATTGGTKLVQRM